MRLGILLLVGVSLSGGCGGSNTAALDPDTTPTPLVIELLVHTTDGREVLFQLDDQRVLHFGGGLNARGGCTQPAGELIEGQLAQLWRLIVDGNLLHAEGTFFGKPQRVRFGGYVRIPSGRYEIHAIDDEVPALHELSRLLFNYQAELRYGDVIEPIETRLKAESDK